MQNEQNPQLSPNIPGLFLLIGAHGQGDYLEDANEEAQHEGTKDGTLPADPVHATRYGQTIEIGMSTTAGNARDQFQLISIAVVGTHPLRSA